ncbi:SPASM domain-containing protein [Thermodesulfobacteriota bacterium]
MCNRKCGYCPNSLYERGPDSFMEFELFLKCIREMAGTQYDGYINYSFYNEPLLDQRLNLFIAKAKQLCPMAKNIIFTNGDLLDLKRFKELVKSGLHKIIITQHDNMISPNIKDVLDRADQEDLKKIKLLFPKNMLLFNRAGSVSLKNEQNHARLKISCYRPSFSMVVTAKGNVLPCCNDFFEKEVMGNVNEEKLSIIWSSKYFVNFRRNLLKGKRKDYELCRNCDWLMDTEFESFIE